MEKNVHEEFRRMMQEAYRSCEPKLEDSQIPKPDLSFLEESEQEEHEPEDIEREEDIKLGADVVPEVYVPEYIPEGFTFAEGHFSNSKELFYMDYTYKKGDQKLLISVDKQKESADVYVAGEPYTTESGKEVYLMESETSTGVNYLTDLYMFSADGPLDKEEIIKIIDHLTLLE